MSPVTRARTRARRLFAPSLVLAAALAAACAEVGTDPDAPVSIEFNRLPSPSILVGDTLRDLFGNVAHLRDSVFVFNRDNDTIVGFPTMFLATVDTARLKYDSAADVLVSLAPTGLANVGVQAQAASLFPAAVQLAIVRNAPTTIDTVHTDSVLHQIFFGTQALRSRSSKEFTVKVMADDSTVTGWPVQFRLVSLPASLDSIRFIASLGDTLAKSRASPFDTTQAGTAARYIAAWAKSGQPNGTDTLVVEALFRVRGEIGGIVQKRIPVIINRPATAGAL